MLLALPIFAVLVGAALVWSWLDVESILAAGLVGVALVAGWIGVLWVLGRYGFWTEAGKAWRDTVGALNLSSLLGYSR